MRKLFLATILSIGLLQAQSLSTIAITVNDDIITTYDIQRAMKLGKLTQQQAVDKLVDTTLFEQEVRKYGVKIDQEEYANYLQKVSAGNGLSVENFKLKAQQQYGDYRIYEVQTKQKMLQEKLIGKIAMGKIKRVTLADTKIYYENNPNLFSSATAFDVVEYGSKNKEVLINVAKNPMLKTDLVTRKNRRLDQTNLNQQITFLLNSTQINTYTPALNTNNGFVMLYLKKKRDYKTIPFEKVKDKIFENMMYERESAYVKDHFEKIKITADIEVLK
ncbi:MAG: hypothetical protein U9N30_01715 [Campylobacterota bacterium]|nr:hypothetical protein [Campylobacterota bacterium]